MEWQESELLWFHFLHLHAEEEISLMSASFVWYEYIYNAAWENPIGLECLVGCREKADLLWVIDRMEDGGLGPMVIKYYLTFCVFAQWQSHCLCLIQPRCNVSRNHRVACCYFGVFFVPLMFVFICRHCVIFSGPLLVAFNLIFLHLSHFFIYLPWQTGKHIKMKTSTLCQFKKKRRALPTRTHL